MKISVIGDIIYDSLNEKELDIMRHFSRTELKAAINMLKEFTAKGNFADECPAEYSSATRYFYG